MSSVWKNCSICKKPIYYGSVYQKCSVSSCRKNAYCSVACWDSHAPVMNHKSAWAEEEKAPYEFHGGKRPARRRIVPSAGKSATAGGSSQGLPKDILIVVSKLKNYIKARGDMNTSGVVSEVLSDIVRRHCDDAVDRARADGRKTLMAKDFKL
ncbi:MAG: hypothetical protein WD025_04420 [Bacteriovoracaceae bacterium]